MQLSCSRFHGNSIELRELFLVMKLPSNIVSVLVPQSLPRYSSLRPLCQCSVELGKKYLQKRSDLCMNRRIFASVGVIIRKHRTSIGFLLKLGAQEKNIFLSKTSVEFLYLPSLHSLPCSSRPLPCGSPSCASWATSQSPGTTPWRRTTRRS